MGGEEERVERVEWVWVMSARRSTSPGSCLICATILVPALSSLYAGDMPW